MAIYNQFGALIVMLANMTDRLIIHVFTVASNIEKTMKLYSKWSTRLRINIYVLVFHNSVKVQRT